MVCNFGSCYEGRCVCMEAYTGSYCDTPSMKRNFFLKKNIDFLFEIIVTTPSPAPQIGQTPPRPVLTPQTVGVIGPKKGQLIDYGRLLGARAGPIGAILALVSGLLLLPLALAFAARQIARGALLPGGGRGYVPVTTGATGATQTDHGIIEIKIILLIFILQVQETVQHVILN
jgi:hypothetical protein